MARLRSIAKMGYYPTPEELTPCIASHLAPKEPGALRILDPCAGEGAALKTIGDRLHAQTYGIEIDRQRGAKAQGTLTQCLVTDYRATRITQGFASLLYLNPPYDWAARQELEQSERYERTFLRETVRYLMPQGILVYLIPKRRLDTFIARMLSYRFESIRLYAFPETLYRQFKQIILFAVRKKTASPDDGMAAYLKDVGTGTVAVPPLPEVPEYIYPVPKAPCKPFTFRTSEIDPAELEEEIKLHGIEEAEDAAVPGKMVSIMPLRHGHLAQLIACGFIRGVVTDEDGLKPLLIKGVTRKIVERTFERQGNTEKEIETDRIVITINAITKDGDILTIE